MRRLAVFPLLLLAACSLNPPRAPQTLYDLGPASAPASSTDAPLAWRIPDVSAPPWLNGDGIAYRLAFQQAQKLEHYRDSHWAAPPPALLTQRLRERLVAPASTACARRGTALLAVNLDEFEQVFTSPSDSHVVLRLHATLWAAATIGGGSAAAVERHFRLERVAPSPDAAGAVRALADAVDAVTPELAAWLAQQTAGCS